MGSRTGTWRPSTPSWPPLPTDFPTHLALNNRGVATDGVSWANLVAMVGIVEAVAFCGQRLDHVRMPSVSTTDVPFRIAGPIPLGGPLGWGRKVIETFVSGQDQGAVM